MPELLTGRGVAVRTGQMSSQQAQELLTSGLPRLDPTVVHGLLGVTGRWPLLLRLVSRILADNARDGASLSAHGAVLLEKLRAGNPPVSDGLRHGAGGALDADWTEVRARALGATIDASTSLLEQHDAERFTELSVFATDEAIPFSLVARLWQATAGLDAWQAGQVCARLARLALVSQTASLPRSLVLHEVVRDFLRAELGKQRLAELNGLLLDAVAADLPAASPLGPPALLPVRVAWWQLGHEDWSMWNHLISHLLDAGRSGDADAVATDLRWIGTRLARFGPAAPAADLARAGTPRAARFRAVLARTAHVLGPTEPPEAVVDVLHSRVAGDPDWGRHVTVLRSICRRPRLVIRWPLTNLADPALR